MTKKRLTFDVELPEDLEGGPFPAGKVGDDARRGPMAAAISENADSLRTRQEIEARIRSENDALAEEHVRLKRLGLITDLIPLDRIETSKLVRDRAAGDDPELSELIASIRDIGLSNPIRVEQQGDGRHELVQGFRRLSAYRALLAETGDAARWGAIPAAILPRGETVEALYRRMVDENMVRKDISFAEMAAMALAYARDPATGESDPERAVAQLFQSAGYQKRSYIRGFVRLMDLLGAHLRFHPQIPRALGLRLSSELEARPGLLERLRGDLEARPDRLAAEELELLRRAADLAEANSDGPEVRPQPSAKAEDGKAKTTFQVVSRLGKARCSAANGRLEIRLDRDFSALDRRKLEAALRTMLDQLG